MRRAISTSLTLFIVSAIAAEFLTERDSVQVEVHTGSYDTIEWDARAELGFIRLLAQEAVCS